MATLQFVEPAVNALLAVCRVWDARPAHSEMPFRDCDLPLNLLGRVAVHFLRVAIVVVEEEEEVGIFMWKETGRLYLSIRECYAVSL